MDEKLTIKLDADVIKRAKRYARQQKRSLSKMVENYFRGVTASQSFDNVPETPIVKELKGLFRTRKKINTKKEIEVYLVKKYLK